jgi:hypothetical protein
MDFRNVSDIETLSREVKGLINVLSDGLNNDVCPTPTDDASVVLSVVYEKIERIEQIVEEEYANRRQAREAEDEDEGEDEDEVVAESNGITVTHKKDHEDGSATFEFHMSDEMLHRLFEIFTVSGIVNGIKYEKNNIDSFIAEQKVINAAKEFEAKMREWEDEEDCDYEPDCRKLREALSAAIKKL